MPLSRWISGLLRWPARLADLLTYDFCPGANRWVNWLKHPSIPLFLGLGMSLVTALTLTAGAWILVCGLSLVLLLGGVWPWISLRGLRARLDFQQHRGTEGEPTPVVLEIVNRCPWPVWGLSLRDGFRRWPGVEPAWALARVGGFSTNRFELDFVPDSRGEFPCAPAKLTTSFPFGLWSASVPVTVEHPLLVWPRITPLASLPDAPDLREWSERLAPRRTGDQGDLTGTRLFRPGDSLRRVHWVQTARQGRLITAERQAAAQASVSIEVQIDPTLHSAPGPNGTLEWTIRAAASLVAAWHSRHAAVDLRVAGETVPVLGEGNSRKLWLDRLARLPVAGLTTPPAATARPRSRGLRLVCTTPQGWAQSSAEPRTATWFVVCQPAEDVCHKAPGGTERIAVQLTLPPACPEFAAVSDLVDTQPRLQHIRQQWDEFEQSFRHQWEQSCHGLAVSH
jgi:uncharacterized protein (DUF58 family)